MHPFFGWWKRAHSSNVDCGPGGCGGPAGFGPAFHRHGPPWAEPSGRCGGGDDTDSLGAGAFGVRRPLRFLAWKLELEEKQVAELAKIIDELKTERAQSAVDLRRSTAALADSFESTPLDENRLKDITTARAKANERLQEVISQALIRIHALLDEEQRKRFGYMLRMGVIAV